MDNFVDSNERRQRTPRPSALGAVFVELAVLLPVLALVALGFSDLFLAMSRRSALVSYAQQVAIIEHLPALLAYPSFNVDDPESSGVDEDDKQKLIDEYESSLGVTGLPSDAPGGPWELFMARIAKGLGTTAHEPVLMLASLDYVRIDESDGTVRGRMMHGGTLVDGDPNIFVHEFGGAGVHGCNVNDEREALVARVNRLDQLVVDTERVSYAPGISLYALARGTVSAQNPIVRKYLPLLPLLSVRFCARPRNFVLGQQATFEFTMVPKKILGAGVGSVSARPVSDME